MKRSLLLAAAALAAVTLVAAGCGDTDEVPADAVAVVDGTAITQASLDELLARAKKSYTAQKREFPKAGTAEYQSLQNQAVAYLVQREEYANEADELGVEVSDEEITKKVDEVKKQYFQNDQKKFEAGLKQQGYTVEALREDIQLAAGLREDLRERHQGRQGVRRRPAEVLRREQDPVLGRGVARRPAHPRQDEGRGRRDPLAARVGRRLREAREGELARPRLEGPGREAHRLARPDGRAVRQGGVRARDERAVRPRQDRVRLPPDPAARGGQGRLRDARSPRSRRRSAPSSSRSGRTRPSATGRRRSRRSTRARSRTPPASSRRTRRPPRKRRPPASSRVSSLDELRELTRRLRAECPWDREQTARTIVPHTVEEAYEVADAALARRPGEAPRRARRPALPGLLPLAAARGAGGRRPRQRRPRGARQARAAPSARVRRGGGPDRRPRARALGGDQDGAGGAQRRLPRRSRVAAGAAPRAQGAAARGGGRLRLARPRGARSRRCARSSTSCSRSSRAPVGRRPRPSPTGAVEQELGDLLFTVVNLARFVNVDPELALRATTGRFAGAGRARRAARRRGGGDWADLDLERQEALVRAGQGRARRSAERG